MPSIQDVADQINIKLDQINQSTAATVAVGNGIRSDLTQVNTNIQSGVVELSTGLFAIWELQKFTNSILEHHSGQNNTVICLLENSNDLLCGITRKLTHQIDLNEQILKSLKRLEGITERVEPGAAGDFDRLTELNERISECCPPEQPEPESCPESCPVSDGRFYRPKGQDWKPPVQPQPPG